MTDTLQIKEYSQTAAGIATLRKKYKDVVFDVRSTAGMTAATQARKDLRATRVALEDMRKKIKSPALERCRLIDAEAKLITGQIEQLEHPIDQQIKAEEQRKEQIKRDIEQAERQRVADIASKIDTIRAIPNSLLDSPASEILLAAEGLKSMIFGADYAEFADQADQACHAALDVLRSMYARRIEREQEQERLIVERAEFAKQQAEAAERDRMAADARQIESDKLAAERAEIEQIRRENELAIRQKQDLIESQLRAIEAQNAVRNAAIEGVNADIDAEINAEIAEIAEINAEITAADVVTLVADRYNLTHDDASDILSHLDFRSDASDRNRA